MNRVETPIGANRLQVEQQLPTRVNILDRQQLRLVERLFAKRRLDPDSGFGSGRAAATAAATAGSPSPTAANSDGAALSCPSLADHAARPAEIGRGQAVGDQPVVLAIDPDTLTDPDRR